MELLTVAVALEEVLEQTVAVVNMAEVAAVVLTQVLF
jgi:hypothetical protein